MANTLTKQATATEGWNAGGYSTGSQTGDAHAQITLVAGAHGIIAGFAPVAADLAVASVQWGIQAVAGQPLQVVEAGTVVATSTVVFSQDTVVDVYRYGTTVYYDAGDWSYTSTQASEAGSALELLVLLYSPGDAVDGPVMEAYVPDITQASMTTSLQVTDGYASDPIVYGAFNDALTLSSAVEGQVWVTADLPAFLTLLGGFSSALDISADFGSSLRLLDSSSATSESLLQYATNMLSGVVTRYNNFDFGGFCRVGMDTYGWKASGLYKIGGESDNGDLLQALVEMAAEDFGTAQGKRLDNIYLGLSTDAQVFIRMQDDTDREVVYYARQRKNEWRSDMQAGITSRYWRMRVELVDATFAELDNVEWVVGVTGRRTST